MSKKTVFLTNLIIENASRLTHSSEPNHRPPQVGSHCHERGDLLFHVLRRCEEIAHTFAADADGQRVAKAAQNQREFHFFPGPSIVHSSNGEALSDASLSASALSAHADTSAAKRSNGSVPAISASASNGMPHGPFPPEWSRAPADSLEFKAWLLVQQNEALELSLADARARLLDAGKSSATVPNKIANISQIMRHSSPQHYCKIFFGSSMSEYSSPHFLVSSPFLLRA